jgi:hypothetical protein
METALKAIKESVAHLAQTRRQLDNANENLRYGRAHGVEATVHHEAVDEARRANDFAQECFLVSWGCWLELLEENQARGESLPYAVAGAVR